MNKTKQIRIMINGKIKSKKITITSDMKREEIIDRAKRAVKKTIDKLKTEQNELKSIYVEKFNFIAFIFKTIK